MHAQCKTSSSRSYCQAILGLVLCRHLSTPLSPVRLTAGCVLPAGVSKATEAAAGATAPSTATAAAAEGKSGALWYRYHLQQPLSQVSMLPQHTSAQLMVWFHRLQDEVQLACVLIFQPGQARVTLPTASAPTSMHAMCLHGCNTCWRSAPHFSAVHCGPREQVWSQLELQPRRFEYAWPARLALLILATFVYSAPVQ
jgi:hypothetical protein